MLGLWRYTINVPPFLFYYNINLTFFCTKIFKHKDTKKPQRTQRKIKIIIIFVLVDFVCASFSLKVNTILDDLQKRRTFLLRNQQREVTWAYPVTVEKMPHHIIFNTGEKFYAA